MSEQLWNLLLVGIDGHFASLQRVRHFETAPRGDRVVLAVELAAPLTADDMTALGTPMLLAHTEQRDGVDLLVQGVQAMRADAAGIAVDVSTVHSTPSPVTPSPAYKTVDGMGYEHDIPEGYHDMGH